MFEKLQNYKSAPNRSRSKIVRSQLNDVSSTVR